MATPLPTMPSCWRQPARPETSMLKIADVGVDAYGPAAEGLVSVAGSLPRRHRSRRRGRQQVRHRGGGRRWCREAECRRLPTPLPSRRWSRRRCSPAIRTGAGSGHGHRPTRASRVWILMAGARSGFDDRAGDARRAAWTRPIPRKRGAAVHEREMSSRSRVLLGQVW